MRVENNTLSIYWLGGSTCAGKTTISNILSQKYGFVVYHCDEHLGEHIGKSNPQKHPKLNRITNINWNDILSMTVEAYLEWSIGLFYEEFDMILEDLCKISDGKPILVEGAGLLPELIKNKISTIDNAIWIVADEALYKKHQMDRKEIFERTKDCLNPEQALQNYMSYDLTMGRYIINNAKRLGLKVIEVGNDCNVIKNVEVISSWFRLT